MTLEYKQWKITTGIMILKTSSKMYDRMNSFKIYDLEYLNSGDKKWQV